MAEDRKWLYSNNVFVNVAKESDENGMKQILYHDAAISAYQLAFPLDADYLAWHNRFHPLRVTAENTYNTFYSIEEAQLGQTVNVNAELKAIKGKTGKARDWYNRTSAIYAVSDPPRFKAIWGHGLLPFRGKKDGIISALKTLSENIGSDANLLMVAIKSEVDAEYAIINPDRNTQKIAIKTTGISRTGLTKSITAALNMQFRDYGLEVDKFANEADMEKLLKSFHNLEEIQSHPQRIFHVTLDKYETLDLATRTLVFNSRLRSKAIGGDVNIYLASTHGGTNSTAVKSLNGVNNKFIAQAFAVTDYGINHYITLVNTTGVPVSFMLQLY